MQWLLEASLFLDEQCFRRTMSACQHLFAITGSHDMVLALRSNQDVLRVRIRQAIATNAFFLRYRQSSSQPPIQRPKTRGKDIFDSVPTRTHRSAAARADHATTSSSVDATITALDIFDSVPTRTHRSVARADHSTTSSSSVDATSTALDIFDSVPTRTHRSAAAAARADHATTSSSVDATSTAVDIFDSVPTRTNRSVSRADHATTSSSSVDATINAVDIFDSVPTPSASD